MFRGIGRRSFNRTGQTRRNRSGNARYARLIGVKLDAQQLGRLFRRRLDQRVDRIVQIDAHLIDGTLIPCVKRRFIDHLIMLEIVLGLDVFDRVDQRRCKRILIVLAVHSVGIRHEEIRIVKRLRDRGEDAVDARIIGVGIHHTGGPRAARAVFRRRLRQKRNSVVDLCLRDVFSAVDVPCVLQRFHILIPGSES